MRNSPSPTPRPPTPSPPTRNPQTENDETINVTPGLPAENQDLADNVRNIQAFTRPINAALSTINKSQTTTRSSRTPTPFIISASTEFNARNSTTWATEAAHTSRKLASVAFGNQTTRSKYAKSELEKYTTRVNIESGSTVAKWYAESQFFPSSTHLTIVFLPYILDSPNLFYIMKGLEAISLVRMGIVRSTATATHQHSALGTKGVSGCILCGAAEGRDTVSSTLHLLLDCSELRGARAGLSSIIRSIKLALNPYCSILNEHAVPPLERTPLARILLGGNLVCDGNGQRVFNVLKSLEEPMTWGIQTGSISIAYHMALFLATALRRRHVALLKLIR